MNEGLNRAGARDTTMPRGFSGKGGRNFKKVARFLGLEPAVRCSQQGQNRAPDPGQDDCWIEVANAPQAGAAAAATRELKGKGVSDSDIDKICGVSRARVYRYVL